MLTRLAGDSARTEHSLRRTDCWEKGPTNLGIEESVTAFSRDSDPVTVSLGFVLDAQVRESFV